MKIVRYEHQGQIRLGHSNPDGISPLLGDLAHDWLALVEALASRTQIATTAETIALADVTLLPPVPMHGKIICIGLNYADHAKEGGHAIPDYPAVFLRTATSLTAHEQPLIRPLCSDRFDFEAELALVIGRTARHVRAADALDYVAGYTCFNDGSLRDFQKKSSQWTMGKNFDRSGSIGPHLVPSAALPNGVQDLRITLTLNDEILQDGRTGDMIFSVPKLIEILSAVMTLEPGDVVATGTPSGVGFARTPPRFMKAGDRCAVEIEGIGVLVNAIADDRVSA